MSDTHTIQKRKNIALFLVLLVLIVLIYSITVMRMSTRPATSTGDSISTNAP